MAVTNCNEILERLANIAMLAGLKAKMDHADSQLVMCFGLHDHRTQMVCARLSAEMKDSVVITIFSPCLRVKSGMFSGISKKQALDLLKRNERTLFARYGIHSCRDSDLVVASVDHILETLDPEEFRHSVYSVAIAADSYEREHGSDQF